MPGSRRKRFVTAGLIAVLAVSGWLVSHGDDEESYVFFKFMVTHPDLTDYVEPVFAFAGKKQYFREHYHTASAILFVERWEREYGVLRQENFQPATPE